MRIFMISDMEGLSCVSYKAQTKPGTDAYYKAQKYLMSDLNAAIKGAHDAGADEIVIYDLHESGKNILLEEIPEYVSVIVGKPPKTIGVCGMCDKFNALFLVGNHSKTYTPNAVFPHAYSVIDGNIFVNGIEVGEIGMEAMIAGLYNVPLAFVSGDKAASCEALSINDKCETAIVKEDAGYGCATCKPLSYTQKLIYEKAKAAVLNLSEMKPFKIEGPYEIEIKFNSHVHETIKTVAGIIQKEDNRFLLRGDNLHKMWEEINLSFCDWLS